MLPIQIKVGGGGNNPVAGDTIWNYPDLKGVNGYIDKSGFGIWGYEKYRVRPEGGIELLQGLTFVANDELSFVPSGVLYDNTAALLPGTYTNGFNYVKVVEKLTGRLGWMQTAGVPTLDSVNSTSLSGRYFNDGSFHTTTTLEALYNSMEQRDATETQFNAYLLALQRAVILRCLAGVFNEPEYVSQSLAYDRWSYGNVDQPILNNHKFIGYQIKVPRVPNLAVQINSVALYFDSVATFNIYVYCDTKKDPIYIKEVTTEANNQVIVDLQNCILNYITDTNHGGIFYIGYYQDDLGSAQAIWETAISFKQGYSYGLTPIESNSISNTNFNRSQFLYTLRTNGINPYISVFVDHTWNILQKPFLFDNMLGMQMTAQSMEQLIWSQRINGTELGLKSDAEKVGASLELTGIAPISDGPKTTGLRKMIQQEADRLKNSFYPKPKAQSISIC